MSFCLFSKSLVTDADEDRDEVGGVKTGVEKAPGGGRGVIIDLSNTLCNFFTFISKCSLNPLVVNFRRILLTDFTQMDFTDRCEKFARRLYPH